MILIYIILFKMKNNNHNRVQNFNKVNKGRKNNQNEDNLSDLEDLNKFRFETQEPSVEVRDINIDITNSGKGWGGNLHLSPILPGEENITGGKKLNSQERDELINLENAQFQKESASLLLMAAEALSHFPDLNLQLSFWGIGSWLHLGKISDALEFSSKIFNSLSDRSSYDAVRSGKMAGYTRREQEWAYQSNLAVGEINQTYKQIRAAQIREALSEREWKNHQQQMKNAEEIERFLTDEKEGKMTNQAFYSWMRREIKGLYSQCFQFAFDLAKKAERAMQYELGDTGLNYIKYGYLSGKEGLLAGDKLFMDIKFMEAAYLEKNQREFELTKHISLVLLNPMSLLDLRTKGECYIEIPEVLFDLDHSGHYMRRIKSVSLSIPCIAGPYTNVSAKLTLHSNRLRRKNNLNEEELSPSYFGIQSIATSHAQNDSGLFELNFRDERYLPFEGAGTISSWRLELPTEFRQFDYATISDVIIHLNYTARYGGDAFKEQVNKQIQEAINNWLTAMENAKQPLALLLSLKDNFPNEWHVLQTDQKADLLLDIKHFPFMMQGWKLKIEQISIYRAGETDPVDLENTGNTILSNFKLEIQENKPETVPISLQSEPLPKNLYVLIHYILTDKKIPPTK